MTPKETFEAALRREAIQGHVPHFELVIFLTMEAVGRIHPCHRDYSQWYQMSRAERRLHLVDMAKAYIEAADKYHHSAIFVHPKPGPTGELPTDIEATREIGDHPGAVRWRLLPDDPRGPRLSHPHRGHYDGVLHHDVRGGLW